MIGKWALTIINGVVGSFAGGKGGGMPQRVCYNARTSYLSLSFNTNIETDI